MESGTRNQDVGRRTQDLRPGTFRNCYIPEVNSKFKDGKRKMKDESYKSLV